MASPRILLNGFQDPRSPTSGWVYTCDASGNGSWQVSASTDAFMPTLIASGATFTIPADKQGLAALPIVIDGTLIVNGSLVML